MAIALDIRFAPGDENRLLSKLDPKRYAWAMKEALNRTATNVATFGHKKVAKEMGLTAKQLYKRGRRTQGGNKFGTVSRGRRASIRKLRTTVTGYGRPFNVTRWDGTPVNNNRATQHSAWGRRIQLEKTWMLMRKPGNPIVKRRGKSFTGVFGPGVAQMMEKPVILTPMQRFANRRFRVHWRSRLRFAFEARTVPLAQEDAHRGRALREQH